jgi:CSLREA domain-containing protein/uncharacterized repeat protein (TIGR01451 family)
MNTRVLYSIPRILIALVMAIGSLLFIHPITVMAASRIVTKVADTNDSVCDADCSLREAIAAAASGDTITFTSGLAGQTITLGSELKITKNLTIDASSLSVNVIISGNKAVRVFNIDPGVTMDMGYLDIVDGFDDMEGGGSIYNAGTLTVHDSTLTGGSAIVFMSGGGAIYNSSSGALTVRYSVFTHNSGTNGGAIYNGGTATIQTTTISDNFGTFGGGIRNSGDMLLENSTISYNMAIDGGGISHFDAFYGTLTVRNSTIFGNSAESNGGGISILSSTVILQNDTIAGNSADHGSGINNEGNLSFENTIVADNIANIPTGGDCYNNPDFGTIVKNNSNLVGDGTCNTGGVDFLSGDPRLTTLADNGGSTWTQALMPDSPAIDTGDNATCPATDQREFTRPDDIGGVCDIGAYEAGPLSLVMEVTPATGVPNHGLVMYTLTLTNISTEPDTAVSLTDTLPSEVSFDSWVYKPDGTTIADGKISWAGSLAGGADVIISFNANHTGDYGDHLTNLAFFSGNLDVGSSEVSFDVPCTSAYVVQNADNSGTGSLRNAIAGVCSGGSITFSNDLNIYLGNQLTIKRPLTIDGGNRTITLSGDDGNNGSPDVRVFNIITTGNVNLDNLNIVNGRSYGGSGGGIRNYAVLTVQDSRFTGNTADGGNSMGSRSGGAIGNFGTLTLTDSNLTGNSCTLYGGGIYNNGTLTIQSSTIANNLSGSYGAGVHNTSTGTLSVQNSTISGNTGVEGGGIHTYGTLTVTNSTISGNSVIHGGGGIAGYNGAAHVTLKFTTISGNIADSDHDASDSGGGVYIGGSGTLTMINSIIAGNIDTTTPATADCKNSSSTLTSQGHNLVGSATGCPSNGTGDLTTATPLLGALVNNGGGTQTHALLTGSPAINHGLCLTGITTDQRGVARPYPSGGQCDIGAFEWNRLRLYLPLTLRNIVP